MSARVCEAGLACDTHGALVEGDEPLAMVERAAAGTGAAGACCAADGAVWAVGGRGGFMVGSNSGDPFRLSGSSSSSELSEEEESESTSMALGCVLAGTGVPYALTRLGSGAEAAGGSLAGVGGML